MIGQSIYFSFAKASFLLYQEDTILVPKLIQVNKTEYMMKCMEYHVILVHIVMFSYIDVLINIDFSIVRPDIRYSTIITMCSRCLRHNSHRLV